MEPFQAGGDLLLGEPPEGHPFKDPGHRLHLGDVPPPHSHLHSKDDCPAYFIEASLSGNSSWIFYLSRVHVTDLMIS